MANKNVRVLVVTQIDGILYQPNDVVSIPENFIKSHAGIIDSHKDAVAYALSINGNRVIKHAVNASKDAVAPAPESTEEAPAESIQPDTPQE